MTHKDHSTGVNFGDKSEKSYEALAARAWRIQADEVCVGAYPNDAFEPLRLSPNEVRRQVLEHWEGKTHTSTDEAPITNDDRADAINQAIHEEWKAAGCPDWVSRTVVGRNNR